jgi:L-ascorbate metabolism protein UlaG (beta-lactamase superfamily)
VIQIVEPADISTMKILQIHNATIVIESAQNRILLDPMLGPVGTLPPYSLVRFRPRKNPLKALPPNAESLLDGMTAGLIT